MRACDLCRKRKKQCKTQDGASSCVTCQTLGISSCTFLEPPPRKRRITAPDKSHPIDTEEQRPTRPRTSEPPQSHGVVPTASPRLLLNQDDDNPFDYPQNSLLSMTLGLEKGRFSELVGPGGKHDWHLFRTFSPRQSRSIPTAGRNCLDNTTPDGSGSTTIRKVNKNAFFKMIPDEVAQRATTNKLQDEVDIDSIERIVHPHGPALVNLYFRIVHPSFPILHKEVFLEKYNRTYREIVPHLLAAVYALAVRWWPYDADLFLEEKVDEATLVTIAHQSVQHAMHRPRLNTIQAGLLLLQRSRDAHFADNAWTWSFTSSLIALGQHLGLHLDCTDWTIPGWEKGLRRRLGWALHIQDTFSAMIFGRPCVISPMEWAVAPLETGDFSESSQDEQSSGLDGGSASVEDGRLLFIELAKLSVITARLLRHLYSVRSLSTITKAQQVLMLAKPLGNSLADLLKNLPPDLDIDNLQSGRLCMNGLFYLALYSTTAVLNRRMVWAIQSSAAGVDVEFTQSFRTAQRQRAHNIVQFVSRLRPEHMEAFWFFAAGGCGVILGSFLGLLRLTSTTADESEAFIALMNEFEWQLRIKSKMADWIQYTLAQLKFLGWDEWKTSQLNFDSQSTEILSSLDTGVDLAVGASASTEDGAAIQPAPVIPSELLDLVLEEDDPSTWLTEDLEGLMSPFWDSSIA